ncbi:MAG: hypothetical protein LBS99_00785 [Clostridiales bacterium]|nr:hypothetical protein [Clostridiales bacterium]
MRYKFESDGTYSAITMQSYAITVYRAGNYAVSSGVIKTKVTQYMDAERPLSVGTIGQVSYMYIDESGILSFGVYIKDPSVFYNGSNENGDNDNGQQATYTLTYAAQAGGAITGNLSQTVQQNGNGTIVTAVANDGYEFIGWSDGVTTTSRTDNNVTANKSVTAQFIPIPDNTAEFAGGNGLVYNPYRIITATHLGNMANYPDAHFKLLNDITLSAVLAGAHNFTPMFSDEIMFNGSFDGNGHKIINLTWYNVDTFYVGLFACISASGSVKNLTLENVNLSGTNYIGGIAGYSLGAITDCAVSGNITHIDKNSYKIFIGGIAGRAGNDINGNSSAVTITVADAKAESAIGGIAGYLNYQGTFTLRSGGAINATSESVIYCGGLIGRAENPVALTNSYATGHISASSSSSSSSSYAGGFAGYGGNMTITDSYATGDISASSYYYYSYAGGFAGYGGNMTITDSYTTGDISASSSSSSSSSYAGGFAGYGGNMTITDSYTTGDISASSSSSSYAGGFAGYTGGNITITDSYTVSKIINNESVKKFVGAFAGRASGTNITNGYWLYYAESGVNYAVGLSESLGIPTNVGSTKKTTVTEMCALAAALNAGRETAHWISKTYAPPILVWQQV